MPSFFESLKRMAQGKPVFDAGDGAEQKQQNFDPQHDEPHSSINKGDPDTYPVVYVRRTTSHLSGNTMRIYCSIHNNSKENVELEAIHILGSNRHLQTFLRPGEEREIEVYSGPRPNNQHHNVAELHYKTHTGDYFAAVHDIEFDYQQADGTYVLEELKLRLPIRDI